MLEMLFTLTRSLETMRSQVEDLIEKAGREIHETIEECMVFANRAVASKSQMMKSLPLFLNAAQNPRFEVCSAPKVLGAKYISKPE